MKAEFATFQQGENWCNGTVGGYVFEAKSFDTGSSFGIDNGRVSKLVIKRADTVGNGNGYFDGVVVSYDRGWDIEPTPEVRPYFDAVMELLENAPKRF